MTAEKLVIPYMPRFDIVNVPPCRKIKRGLYTRYIAEDNSRISK